MSELSVETDYPRRPGSWCYRMTREQRDGEDFFTIREIYTGGDGSLSWSADPIAARGDSWMECADDLALMGRALGADVLDLTLDPPALVSVLDLRRALRTPPGQTGGDR